MHGLGWLTCINLWMPFGASGCKNGHKRTLGGCFCAVQGACRGFGVVVVPLMSQLTNHWRVLAFAPRGVLARMFLSVPAKLTEVLQQSCPYASADSS